MEIEFRKIFEEISPNNFIEILEENLEIKRNEMEKIKGKKILVIGDLHGNFDSLSSILKKIDLNEFDKIIFLGDYGDRGSYQVETYYLLLKLRVEIPKKVLMIRGNHEFLEGYQPYPHDLPLALIAKFGKSKAAEIYSLLKNFWERLPFCCISKNYFFVHGGIPVNIASIKELEKPNDEIKLQLLWNDPFEGNGYEPSYRGVGYLFGKDITQNFLKIVGVKKVIRGHEPCNGYKINHEGKVLTIFSMKGYYGNQKASFLIIDNEIEKIEIF